MEYKVEKVPGRGGTTAGHAKSRWLICFLVLVATIGIAGGITRSEAAARPSGASSGGGSAGPDANQAPVANNNAYRIKEDQTLRISARGVLGNDRDPDGDKLSARKVSNPRHGRLTLRGNGSFTYKPKKNYNGTDSFIYEARDGKGKGSRARVTIRVRGTNDRPVARNNSFTTSENRKLVVKAPGVLRNDKDVDGDRLTAAKVSGVRHGKLTLRRNGSFTYEPRNGYSGRDSFVYKARDGKGGSDRATVRIMVRDANDPPDEAPRVSNTTPADGATGVAVDSTITIEFSEEVNASQSSFELKCPASGPARTFSLGGGGTGYTLTPDSDLSQGTTCQVRVKADQISDTDTDDPPNNMANDFTFSFTTEVAATADSYPQQVIGNVGIDSARIPYSITENDELDDQTTITFFGWNGTSGVTEQGGEVSVVTSGPNRGEFTYNPPAGYEGSDQFTYTIKRGDSESTATVTIPVDGMIWFVDNEPGASTAAIGPAAVGDGRLSNPFTTLAAFNADAVDEAGDNIFLYEGGTDYTGGITLLDDQRLVGQDAGSGLSAITGLNEPSGSDDLPDMDTGTDDGSTSSDLGGASGGVTVGSGNGLHGFNAVPTGGTGISGNTFGTLTVRNVGVDTGGPALDLTGGTLDANFDGVSSSGGAKNVNLVNVGGGAVLGSGALSGSTDTAFDVEGGDADVSYDGTITTANRSVEVTGHTGGTVAFGGEITNGLGINLQNNGGATINFSGGLDLDTATNTAFNATGGGTVNVLSDGVSTTADTTTGTVVRIENTSIGSSGVTFDSTGSTGGGNGILLSNAGSGAFTTDGGSIFGKTTRGVDVDGGSGNVTVAASIGATPAGRSVEVTGHTGGTVRFSGAIDDNGLGINLQNNGGATINFSGGLDLDTATNTAFNATGGGTVNATGTGSDVDTTTGTGVNIANTTIGADGVTFQSVSANGADNGILLDSTGTNGGLTVTGNGDSCTAATPTCTGGRIQSSTGADSSTAGSGLYLNNTGPVSLSFMRIDNHPNYAIFGDTVNGFSLIDSVVDGSNGNNDSLDEGSIRFDDLLGSGAITRTDISGGHEDNLRLVNETGTLDRLVITDSSFSDNSDSLGNDGILLESRSSATMNVTVTGTDFRAHRGDHFDANATDTSALDIVFENNTMTGGHPNALGQTFVLSNGASADVTFDVSGNSINGAILSAFTFFQSAATTTSSSLVGTFSGNTIGTTGNAGSGSSQGHGAVVNATGNGTVEVLADDNEIRQWSNEHGFLIQAGDGSPTLNATISNNTIKEPNTASFPTNGLHLNAGTTAAGTASVCLDARSNDMVGAGAFGADDFRLRQRNNSTVNLPGYGGSPSDTAAVVNFVQSNNTGSPSGSASVSGSGGGFTGTGAGCPTS